LVDQPGDEDAEEVEQVFVFCPECAEREFGGREIERTGR
jgi:hypothetical protein